MKKLNLISPLIAALVSCAEPEPKSINIHDTTEPTSESTREPASESSREPYDCRKPGEFGTNIAKEIFAKLSEEPEVYYISPNSEDSKYPEKLLEYPELIEDIKSAINPNELESPHIFCMEGSHLGARVETSFGYISTTGADDVLSVNIQFNKTISFGYQDCERIFFKRANKVNLFPFDILGIIESSSTPYMKTRVYSSLTSTLGSWVPKNLNCEMSHNELDNNQCSEDNFESCEMMYDQSKFNHQSGTTMVTSYPINEDALNGRVSWEFGNPKFLYCVSTKETCSEN